MVRVEIVRIINCRPETFLEFVMDIERYTTVDDKIGRIVSARRENTFTEFCFEPRLPGFPLPQPRVAHEMRLTPWKRIDIGYAPLPQNRLSRRIVGFTSSFACEPDGDRTKVTRMISFDFAPVVRWIFEPVLRRKLRPSIERELRLAQEYLERRPGK
jgi:hypothetical protein